MRSKYIVLSVNKYFNEKYSLKLVGYALDLIRYSLIRQKVITTTYDSRGGHKP